jgi:hypothetical protein
VKITVDINVSSKAWSSFLQSQSKEYPAYFDDPFSEAAMSYFKEMLEKICRRAIEQKSCSVLHSFIQSVKNERSKALMLTWLDTYSSIRQIKTKNGIFQ